MVYVYTHMQEYLECCVATLVGTVTACPLSGLLEIQSSAQSWHWPAAHHAMVTVALLCMVGDPSTMLLVLTFYHLIVSSRTPGVGRLY